MATDEVLVKRVQGGELAAYGDLVERYQDRVYGLATRLLATTEDARDAAQEIFLRVFRALPGFDLRADFATWLYRIATNVCLDMLRRRRRERLHNLQLGSDPDRDDLLRDDRAGPEEVWLVKERLRELRRAVMDLPDDYRVALVLHHYQQMSYRQVAACLGLPEKTVATRIHRAKLMLRQRLLPGGESDAL
jgi:RNA polymerase sigma-70 factor (ECF subfamily)